MSDEIVMPYIFSLHVPDKRGRQETMKSLLCYILLTVKLPHFFHQLLGEHLKRESHDNCTHYFTTPASVNVSINFFVDLLTKQQTKVSVSNETDGK